jgi:WD40 repeat protein
VSSPGDVTPARELVAQVVEKLAHEYARFYELEPYLWEYEPMVASGHFQDSIDPPSQFDAVIIILESRLGTPLPEKTAVREYRGIDGRTPVTGTEWEFEDALTAARERGVPDLLVYRSQRNAELPQDPAKRPAIIAQIEALDVFWSRHFADRGAFIGAYAEFKSLEEFAAKVEKDLRRCVERRIAALSPTQHALTHRLWAKEPFRGLEAYEFQHAPIFFGRDEAVGAALFRLVTNAELGRPFLLILGASGSGKSSLVKAGVVPRLLVPQRVSGTAFLRRAVFRASDAHVGEDLFDALARCLTEGHGEDIGIPELLDGSMPVKEFARHLRQAAAHPDLPFAMVLNRLAESAREHGRMLRYQQARLILVVDQLEEIYTGERLQPEERKRFVELLGGLVRSGLVWVIATMRADFWHRATEIPELLHLADGQGRLDLMPPSPAELSQMLRGPAEAAAVSFETHPSTGIPLNDVIAQEAAGEPGALPLMSYLLDQLYRKDVREAGGNTLTYATYHALGGLKGAITTRAEAVLSAQTPDVRLALRPVLFALVQISATEANAEHGVARRAPLSDFPEGTAKRRLVDALLDPSARLLVADATGDRPPTVRLAHEALINEWQTAHDYVSASAELLKTRRRLEDRYVRWQALTRDGARSAPLTGRRLSTIEHVRAALGREQGLLKDVDLIDASRLLRDYREELAPNLVSYIDRSIAQDRKQHRRAVRSISAVAAVMTLLAIGAGYEAKVARQQRDAAEQSSLRSLTQTASARLKEADISEALGIILGVLGRQSLKVPYSPAALNVFQEARAADAQIQIITGHRDRVYSAAYSADGRRIVTASDDKTARVWDAVTGAQLVLLSGHAARVQDAQFLPDGRRIVTASWDKTARIWDAATGVQILVLKGHGDAVETAEFSPDGRNVVTASRDGTARIWNALTGEQVAVLGTHTDRVYSAKYSADGLRIVTASADKTARIWDIAGHQIRLLSGHLDAVTSAAFSPDGRRIVTSSADNTARVWDASTQQQLLVLRGHRDTVYEATFSSDARRIVTASADMTVRLWDATTGEQSGAFLGATSFVLKAEFSPDGQRVVAASNDNTVRIWDSGIRRQILLLAGHTKPVIDAAFSPDGRRVVTASFDQTARIWDAGNGALLTTLSGHTDALGSAAFSPSGERVVTASYDKTARVWDSASGQQISVLAGSPDVVVAASFSPDGRRVVTASYDNTARIWDADTSRSLMTLKGHTDRLETAEFSPDGQRIVTASDDKTARIWSASTGRQLLVLRGHTDRLLTATFSHDGGRIITAANDGTVRIWDASTGQQLLMFSGHMDLLDSAAFSPDGHRVVTTSDDKSARIWDAATGQQLLVLMGHRSRVEIGAFARDGKRLVTASDDTTARIWDTQTPGLDVQITWANAAQFDPLSMPERFALGLPDSTDQRRSLGPSTPCDDLAAAPYDPDRRAVGVFLSQIAADAAVQSCSAKGSSARLTYQLGRALFAAHNYSAAKREFEKAHAQGYRSASVDLAMLLSDPSAGLLDLPRAASLYEDAWKNGVRIGAFELGKLYERGLKSADDESKYTVLPDPVRAWDWYQKGVDSREPSALARFGERADTAASKEEIRGSRNSLLLAAFSYYAASAERARYEQWPDEAWRDWRRRRASLARILEREGMMQQVATAYTDARASDAPTI